jgi:hypothetical protein
VVAVVVVVVVVVLVDMEYYGGLNSGCCEFQCTHTWMLEVCSSHIRGSLRDH